MQSDDVDSTGSATLQLPELFYQGCGSAFIFCGSGSSCFLNANPDPALKTVVEKNTKRELKSKNHGAGPNLLNHFNKITVIINFIEFFLLFLKNFPPGYTALLVTAPSLFDLFNNL